MKWAGPGKLPTFITIAPYIRLARTFINKLITATSCSSKEKKREKKVDFFLALEVLTKTRR